MAPRTTTKPGLSDEELVQVVALMQDSDAVELKLTVRAHFAKTMRES